ncbi:uncharacterized protein LOC122267910 [Penaeus japonicus]|uniref:uncharacterized protein LOC122267910 n=1 Tax=Penaeus japonicus TaxID=27405 RepID=UPI001C715352|nr:uncharacterized protein LOC122267910 [Penaeus japonicus]
MAKEVISKREENWDIECGNNDRKRERADLMQRKKVDVLCLQETKWDGQKAKEMGEGYKLYYSGVENKRNGIVIVLSPEMRVMLGGIMLHIPEEEVWLGGDLNGQVGEWNRKTDIIECHGIGRRNPEENTIVDFALANQLAVLNTFFRK